MIFLAVTMGFFAENLREHIGEKKKEKEYIKGIVSDLSSDTTRLTQVIKYYDALIPLMDSGRKNFYKLQQPGSLRTVGTIQMSMAGFLDFILYGYHSAADQGFWWYVADTKQSGRRQYTWL